MSARRKLVHVERIPIRWGVVFIDRARQPVRIPQSIRERLQ